jgi:L-fuconate dehydratase
VKLTGLDCLDIRFPTSRERDGSDAMNPTPDYSAAYVTLSTGTGSLGHGFAFTIGRGNDAVVAAVETLRGHVIGRDAPVTSAALAALSSDLIGDGQLRWLGPEKGIMHMAIGAVLNAAWDLAAKEAGKPLWKFLADLPSEEIVGLVDFRYLVDALTPDEALGILRAAEPGRAAREAELRRAGYPAYTTTPGWLGYTDEKLARLSAEAVADGFRLIKVKVGGNVGDDLRRMRLARETVGPGIEIAVDANQRWSVPDAIDWIRQLAPFEPSFVEEPTSPDDVLGHAAIRSAVEPIRLATGEAVQNRIIFKQLLQARAIDIVQIDATRVAGPAENIAIMLLAAKFGLPVCPHAGGVGLCELVQHLAMFDFVAVSGSMDGRVIEYVDHLHEHFTDPVTVRDGHYLVPDAPGSSATMQPASLSAFSFPNGPAWLASDLEVRS